MAFNLFAYGTLTFPEVWKRIHVGEFESKHAIACGYSIYRVRDAVFPGIVKSDSESSVSGKVYFDLDEETLFELDAYESDLYDRIEIQVQLENGEEVTCFSYVIPERRKEALSDEAWDATHFEEHELEKYLNG